MPELNLHSPLSLPLLLELLFQAHNLLDDCLHRLPVFKHPIVQNIVRVAPKVDQLVPASDDVLPQPVDIEYVFIPLYFLVLINVDIRYIGALAASKC